MLLHTSYLYLTYYIYSSGPRRAKDPSFELLLLPGDCGKEWESVSSPHTSLLTFLGRREKEGKTLGPCLVWPSLQTLQVLHIFSEPRKYRGMCVRGSPHYSEFCLRQTPNQLSHRIASDCVAGSDIDCRKVNLACTMILHNSWQLHLSCLTSPTRYMSG